MYSPAPGVDVHASQDCSVLRSHEYSSFILYLIFINPVRCQIRPLLAVSLARIRALYCSTRRQDSLFALLRDVLFIRGFFMYTRCRPTVSRMPSSLRDTSGSPVVGPL